jgi:hypothetical protein
MTFDTDLSDRLAYARSAEPTAAEIARLQRELARPVRRRRRGVVVLLGLVLAVPATALASDGVRDALDSFLGLSESAPLALESGTVIDEQAGVRFSVIRAAPDDVCLSLNRSVELCGDPGDRGWREQLGDAAVAPIGTIPPRPRSGPVPLFVLTAPAAHTVQVTYERGVATRRTVGNRGAVILVDADRGPRLAIARDASGTELGRVDISDRQWQWCYREAGCPEMQ